VAWNPKVPERNSSDRNTMIGVLSSLRVAGGDWWDDLDVQEAFEKKLLEYDEGSPEYAEYILSTDLDEVFADFETGGFLDAIGDGEFRETRHLQQAQGMAGGPAEHG
jgi:hypothetical protein